MHMFNRGKYELAFKLSWKIVGLRKQLLTNSIVNLLVLPEYLQLMDDDIVSIVGLAVLFHRNIWTAFKNRYINPVVLMTYIAGQCLLKLNRPYSGVLICVRVASQILNENGRILSLLDRLLVTYIEHRLTTYHPLLTLVNTEY